MPCHVCATHVASRWFALHAVAALLRRSRCIVSAWLLRELGIAFTKSMVSSASCNHICTQIDCITNFRAVLLVQIQYLHDANMDM